MIIALDETGDFRVGSTATHYFVAAHVRTGKEAQYKRWERRLPRRLKSGGEFKGRRVPQLHEVSRVLVKMAEIAKEEHGQPVLDWDKDMGKLFLIDPFFVFYLRWRIAGQRGTGGE